ncbi:hypothetical protein [Brevundimonas sp. CEF1]|uniref:hypothetical protein n=1 Tax=Brevundimonas sp. CEF1 TaxID=3442642 RepID=UPI003F50DA87
MAEATGRHELRSSGQSRRPSSPDLTDYPVREYVAAMAVELASMARWDGDEKLAFALEAAADMARRETPSD